MSERDVAACIVTNYVPHHSEYSGEHWLAREFISGFTGSAGDVVVTLTGGGLWTDGRYFLQAHTQLAGSSLVLFKQPEPQTPTIPEWLAANLAPGARVATVGSSINVSFYCELIAALTNAGIELSTDVDLVGEIWNSRPQCSAAPLFEHPLTFAGMDRVTKLARLRRALVGEGSEALILSALPDIAWLLNLRGADVPFCPLFEANLFVDAKTCLLCIDKTKVSTALADQLHADGVELRPLGSIKALAQTASGRLSLCPMSTNSELYLAMSASAEVVLQPPPTTLAKACKSEAELGSIRDALRYDGVAMVQFHRWLESNVPQGTVTELRAEEVLTGFRADLPHYLGQSFRTIAGFAEHGALMHYAASPQSDAVVGDENFFLVDSGGQYLGGTTDVTRTFAFGELSQQHREDYTRVLQAVIRLSAIQFRKGARGCNLDVMARGVLWQAGIDYDCGTGHGVGQCLVVHEGPQGLSQRLEDVPFEPGMLITNEPGVYRPGEYGIRIENIMLVVPGEVTQFGEFYRFETLTLAPIQTRALMLNMLSQSDRAWLNAYHLRVARELGPLLPATDKDWLETACASV